MGSQKVERWTVLDVNSTDDAPGHDAVSLPRLPDCDILTVPVCMLASTALKPPHLAQGYEKLKHWSQD